VEKETKTWKKCLVERKLQLQHHRPSFECDQYNLPRLTAGIKQTIWVQNTRKFLQSLTFQERNVILTGDPFVEFDPFTYKLANNYSEQIQNYPYITHNFQHIVNISPLMSQQRSPSTSGSSRLQSSREKVIKVQQKRTITTFAYLKPKTKSWLQEVLAKAKLV
jgi:hypothetical protein